MAQVKKPVVSMTLVPRVDLLYPHTDPSFIQRACKPEVNRTRPWLPSGSRSAEAGP